MTQPTPFTAAGRGEGQQVAVAAVAEHPAGLAARESESLLAGAGGPSSRVVQIRESGRPVAVGPVPYESRRLVW